MEYLILNDLSIPDLESPYSQFNEVLTIKCVINEEFENDIRLCNSRSWQPYHGKTITSEILLLHNGHFYKNLTTINDFKERVQTLNSWNIKTELVNEINTTSENKESYNKLSEYSLKRTVKGFLMVLHKEFNIRPLRSINFLKLGDCVLHNPIHVEL